MNVVLFIIGYIWGVFATVTGYVLFADDDGDGLC